MPLMMRFLAIKFQSTRPRGRTRHGHHVHTIFGFGFNPRVLAGGRDKPPQELRRVILVSIHASSREDATKFL